MTEIRPFHRNDREQLAALVNAHVAAVVPAASVSTSHLLATLEREPGEFVVDPWVVDRRTLVAESRGRVVAAAHVLRYGSGAGVGAGYREAAEIRWLLFWPDASFWPDAAGSAEELLTACLRLMDRWRAPRRSADGTLPVPGVYGVPDVWPHVRAVLLQAGFVPGGRTEVVLLADVDALAGGPEAPEGVTFRRRLGVNGTRFTAVEAGTELGYVEVDTNLTAAERTGRGHWADVGNLEVPADRPDVPGWLHTEAARWLRLGGVRRLLAYAADEPEAEGLERLGFRVLTRTERDFQLPR